MYNKTKNYILLEDHILPGLQIDTVDGDADLFKNIEKQNPNFAKSAFNVFNIFKPYISNIDSKMFRNFVIRLLLIKISNPVLAILKANPPIIDSFRQKILSNQENLFFLFSTLFFSTSLRNKEKNELIEKNNQLVQENLLLKAEKNAYLVNFVKMIDNGYSVGTLIKYIQSSEINDPKLQELMKSINDQEASSDEVIQVIKPMNLYNFII